MDQSPHYTSAAYNPSSSTISRPKKVIMQRQYREKEGECFNSLRDIIQKLTGEVLQTRHEILTKAIQLLMTFPELRRSREDLNASSEATSPIGFDEVDLAQMDSLLQSFSRSQNWQPTSELLGSQSDYFQFSGQYHQSTSNQGGYGVRWSHLHN